MKDVKLNNTNIVHRGIIFNLNIQRVPKPISEGGGYPSPGGSLSEGTWDQRLGYALEGEMGPETGVPLQKGHGTKVWESIGNLTGVPPPPVVKTLPSPSFGCGR